jgi:HAD superfamily hydrolase (TIGR01549 family)
LARLQEREAKVVLASSGKEWEVDHYLDLLDGRKLLDEWTTSADVDDAKPHPDVIEEALKKVGGGEAVVVGDSVWDCEAAKRASVPMWGVLTGGFSEDELRGAGAERVYESVAGIP